jgi:hypothetical protein
MKGADAPTPYPTGGATARPAYGDATGDPADPRDAVRPAWDRTDRPTVPGLAESSSNTSFDDRVARADAALHPERTTDTGAGGAKERDMTYRSDVGDWNDDGPTRYEAARTRARMAKGRAYARSRDLKARIHEGTENMSDAARDRVIRARAAAADAQAQVEMKLGQASRSGRRAYDRQPLIGGLVAFAAGAAIAAMLPRTDREDEMLGTYRDRAFDEADRIWREEVSKLRAVAEAAVDEARDVVSEKVEGAKAGTPTGEEAVDKVEGEARDAVARVKAAAESEAEKQKLGSNLN